jgi:hypothetical protein
MNSIAWKSTTLAFIAIVAASTNADMPPPLSPIETYSNNRQVNGLKLGSSEVILERTTLAEVLEITGNGQIAYQGSETHDGEGIYWICYTIEGAAQNERIWFISSVDMGGSKHVVTGITAQVAQLAKSNDDCPTLANGSQPLAFEALDTNIWLGGQTEKVLRLLGYSSRLTDRWRIFKYEGKTPGNCGPDGFDLMNSFSFETSNGNLVTIHARQITSC